jgi:hypothetical protein
VVLDLIKGFSASIEIIKWFLPLLLLMCYITFIDFEPPLHPWDEADLVLVNDLYAMFLDLVCHYFIEDFYIDVH